MQSKNETIVSSHISIIKRNNVPRKIIIVLILFSALGFGLFKAAKTPKLKLSRIETIEDKLAWQSLHLISFQKLKNVCTQATRMLMK